MYKMVIFTATFTNQSGEIDVIAEIRAYLCPESLECSKYKTIETQRIELVMAVAYGTLPVKLIPAKCFELVMVSPKTGPSAGTKLTTPAGTPASLQILNISQFDSSAVSLGFHNTALP